MGYSTCALCVCAYQKPKNIGMITVGGNMKFLGGVIAGVILGYLVGAHLAQANFTLDGDLFQQAMMMNEYINNGMLAGGVIGGLIGLFS